MERPIKRSERVIVDTYSLIKDRDAFEHWWQLYKQGSKKVGSKWGSKEEAALRWIQLEKAGIDTAQVIAGTQVDVDVRLSGKTNQFLPYGCSYLIDTSKHPGRWRLALQGITQPQTSFSETFPDFFDDPYF